MRRRLFSRYSRKAGQALVEYALIAALSAVAVFTGLQLINVGGSAYFRAIETTLAEPGGVMPLPLIWPLGPIQS
ncbi:MAG: hypothetical protein M3R24_01180 [Chloroflexota bacterium]|nr:hypothetical protein [Chloroflexota bacterium]